jgi:uncharacterized membrane protein
MKTIQLTAGTNYHAGLRNLEKDAKGNYVGASEDYAGAAKAAYAANAEARLSPDTTPTAISRLTPHVRLSQASKKTITKEGAVLDAKPAADDGAAEAAAAAAAKAKVSHSPGSRLLHY